MPGFGEVDAQLVAAVVGQSFAAQLKAHLLRLADGVEDGVTERSALGPVDLHLRLVVAVGRGRRRAAALGQRGEVGELGLELLAARRFGQARYPQTVCRLHFAYILS